MTAPEAAELAAVDAALAGREVGPEHAELADLARLLRDDRPEPTPTWAAALDRRAAAGFPSRRRRRLPRPSLRWLAPLATAGAVLLIPLLIGIALVAGDGFQGDDEAQTSGAGAAAEPAGGGVEEESAGGAGAVAPSQPVPPVRRAGDPDSDSRANRAVQRSATMTLSAPPREIDAVATRVGAVAADLGGFVASSSISSTDGGSLALRVPSVRLDAAIQRLSQLGDVRQLSRETEDITAVAVSARERLGDARTERRGLLGQLEDADTVNETRSIRARLRIVSREIAAARGRVRSVDNRARYADLAVTLVARAGDGADDGAWTPGDALRDALRVLEVIAGAALVALAVLSPLLLGAVLWWLARRGLVRRRRERALDAA